MKMKSLILIFIALGCGLVASIGISQVMSQGGKSSKIEMDQILVAKEQIDAGAKLDANLVQLEDWPKIKIPDGATRKIEEVQAKYATVRFFKGEPILQAKISENMGGVIGSIPEGFRVTPIKVDEDTVMEAITPGDTVDVNVFLEQGKNGIKVTGVYTILRNVRVFAKGNQTERSTSSDGKEVRARTVSLLVKPEQSRELVLAYRLGKISLALRPPGSADSEAEDNITPLDNILQAKGSSANEANGSGGSGPDFFRPPAYDLSGPQPRWRFQVVTPKGGSEYVFMEEGAPPIVHRYGESEPPSQPPPQSPPPGAASGGNGPAAPATSE
ncbi:MAG TPA: Flp pilus assembly protein CpaB [Pirellulaceae bacterium]|jgi:pilus assembly protein CpaB|nr:Flp pilus assembly protein CpaB [Pirellulaceae bacterium]